MSYRKILSKCPDCSQYKLPSKRRSHKNRNTDKSLFGLPAESVVETHIPGLDRVSQYAMLPEFWEGDRSWDWWNEHYRTQADYADTLGIRWEVKTVADAREGFAIKTGLVRDLKDGVGLILVSLDHSLYWEAYPWEVKVGERVKLERGSYKGYNTSWWACELIGVQPSPYEPETAHRHLHGLLETMHQQWDEQRSTMLAA